MYEEESYRNDFECCNRSINDRLSGCSSSLMSVNEISCVSSGERRCWMLLNRALFLTFEKSSSDFVDMPKSAIFIFLSRGG